MDVLLQARTSATLRVVVASFKSVLFVGAYEVCDLLQEWAQTRVW